MFLKPKLSVRNEIATAYRRYTDIIKTFKSSTKYKVVDKKGDYHYFVFDKEKNDFIETESVGDYGIDVSGKQVGYFDEVTKELYLWQYNPETKEWQVPSGTSDYEQVPTAIVTYQKNTYYYVGKFSFMRRGGRDSDTTQPIKGLITNFTTMSIRYFNDSINLRTDDMVVIDNRLFMVGQVSVDEKHLPNDYRVYFADLSSIV